MTQKNNRPIAATATGTAEAGRQTHGQSTAIPGNLADRLERLLLAEARELGFRLAVQCTACGHWLTSAKSVAAHRGPHCRRRDAQGQREAA